MLERDGRVIAQPVPATNGKTLKAVIGANVANGATVYTDSHGAYSKLRGYNHEIVNHAVGEYVRGQAHTNGIESFWALLKRGHYGVYHYMSFKHLHRYINEFSFRHNTRKVGTLDFIGMTITRAVDKRLTYKGLINAA
jgi:transposase-like protein